MDRKPIFYEHYIKNGVIFIQDLIDEQGQFQIVLEYASLVKAVKDTLSITNIQKVIIPNRIFQFKLHLFFKNYKMMPRNVQHFKQVNNNTNSTNKIFKFRLYVTSTGMEKYI